MKTTIAWGLAAATAAFNAAHTARAFGGASEMPVEVAAPFALVCGFLYVFWTGMADEMGEDNPYTEALLAHYVSWGLLALALIVC